MYWYTLMYIYNNTDYYQGLLETRSSLISVEKNTNMRSGKQMPNGQSVE